MTKSLVIVESPTKIKTLKKFLGKDFFFESSLGHIRDLPAKDFGIDLDHDFDPTYVTMPDKKDVIKKLKAAAKKADIVYLSPDPDREGEAIAWHISSILPKETKIKRMVFHSITKKQVFEALKNPREIDLALVNAQQARRLLDRMVGYKISPILTRKVKRGKGTSAGRVQSVALKLVVDREKEIEAFKPVEYWTINANLSPEHNGTNFDAFVTTVDGKKVEKENTGQKNIFLISNEKTANDVAKRLKKGIFEIEKIDRKEKKRNPVPPFITSTLQQEASRHHNFSVSRTMSLAQGLYEGIDMETEGTEGLITYMRTDSVQVATEAIYEARDFIEKTYGKEFLPEKSKQYSSKKSAQEAHEAIRPTNMSHPPELIKQFLNEDQFKLYSLIWKRFIASQMKSAVYDTASVDIKCDGLGLKTTGSILKFRGFLAVYTERFDKDDDANKLIDEAPLPNIQQGDKLNLNDVKTTQSHTKPPARFTEASLVKELEKSGIGRPSTYAAIMNKIQSREYTTKENHALKPTELGRVIAQMLEENFPTIMDVGFTASMEDELEKIAENKGDWKELLRTFWSDFYPMVEKAEQDAVVPKIMTDIDCPKCGKKLQKVWSKSKYFYGCSAYPDCDFTAPIEALSFKKEDYAEDFDWGQTCPVCSSKMQIRYGKFGPFLGCVKYPDCSGIVNIPKKGEKVESLKDMPSCPAIGCDGKIISRKSRYGKTFYSCSNFPDCDVIVNKLEDLPTKYKDHPKTAYQKPKKGAKRGGLSRKLILSKELSDVLNEKELSRGEVIKKLWVYIKEKNLQDPSNKRLIVPDEKLAKVFGSKDPVDMMRLSGIIKNHLK